MLNFKFSSAANEKTENKYKKTARRDSVLSPWQHQPAASSQS